MHGKEVDHAINTDHCMIIFKLLSAKLDIFQSVLVERIVYLMWKTYIIWFSETL